MDLGASFINVFDGLAGEGADVALILALAQQRNALRGRPCVFWVSRPVTLRGNHGIPPNVTLSFAPGASLTLHGELIVEGPLDAGLETRFALFGQASLLLLGPLEEIVADWWLPTARGTAVEQALAALWTRYQRDRLPAPIRLDGPYSMSRPLRIRPPADLTGRIEVRLRGQWARSIDPPTFVAGAGDAATPMSTLVSVEDGVVLQVEHVCFDAGPRAQGAQALTGLSLEGAFDGSSVEACGFRYAGAGIWVSPNVQRWIEATGDIRSERALDGMFADASALATSRANGVAVSHCVFTGVATVARAIDVGEGAPTRLDARDCQFVGTFANAVAIVGGEVQITACQFASETTRVSKQSLTGATADVLVRRWGELVGDGRFLAVPQMRPVFLPRRSDVVDHEMFQAVDPVYPPRDGTSIYSDRPLTNTHVTITHCVSTSPVFLVLSQTFSSYGDIVRGGAMLTSVRHSPSGDDPTSVYVRPEAPSRSLILQGCYFGGSVVLDEGSADELVVDLGTTFSGRPGVGFRSNPAYRGVEVVDLSVPR